MRKKLLYFVLAFVFITTMILTSCEQNEPQPQQTQPQIDERTSEIAAELNAKAADLDYYGRLREVVVLNDREQVGYVRVNVNLRLSSNRERNNIYFADKVELLMPVILETLENYGTNFSRIGFNAYNRSIAEDSTGAIRYITYDGVYGLYTDVSWGRGIEEEDVRWGELPRG